jgi:predicted phage terminase large subunit-like protein
VSRSSELLSLERSKALGDFYWFCKYVVHGDRQSNYIVPHVHRDLCDTLQTLDTIKNRGVTEALILMPRGTLKSTITAQAWPVWYLLHNPDARILIASATTELATLNMRAIKSIYENNEYFRELFGDRIKRNERGVAVLWNQDEILVSGRTRSEKEASITVGAINKIKAGSHYTVGVLDDVVNHLNTNTASLVEKTKTFYAQIQSQLLHDEPGSVMPIVGTRYLYDDLYGWLNGVNEDKKVLVDKVIIKKAIDENGNLLFPEVLTHEVLANLREKQGAYHFACQYQNEPTNPDTAVFLREDFRYIGTHVAEVPKNVSRFLLVDPSRGDNETSDFSACVAVALDEQNNVYVELADQRRLKPSELADWIYDLHKLYNFDRIGVEQVGMQGIYDLIMDRANRGEDFIPVCPVKNSSNQSKVMRIMRMEPYFKARKVYLMPGLTDLEDQLERFPNIRKDDLIDALSMAPSVMFSPGSVDEEEASRGRSMRTDVARNTIIKKPSKNPEIAWMHWGNSRTF